MDWKQKKFGVIFNKYDNIIIDSRINNNYLRSENDNDIYNDKGNVKYLEKCVSCVENTKIKVILFDNIYKNYDSNDNSEEAFLEIIKII